MQEINNFILIAPKLTVPAGSNDNAKSFHWYTYIKERSKLNRSILVIKNKNLITN
jgi:hypothetical protein